MKPKVGSVVMLTLGIYEYPALVLCIVEDGSNKDYPMLNLAYAKIDDAGNQTGYGPNEVDLALSTFHADDKHAHGTMHTWRCATAYDIESILGNETEIDIHDKLGV
jgi:hypothetical protein